jgi:hypothetical protein
LEDSDLGISRGSSKSRRVSLDETRNHLVDGRDRGYLADPLYSRLQNLARAARKSTTSLMLSKKRDAERLKRRRRTP